MNIGMTLHKVISLCVIPMVMGALFVAAPANASMVTKCGKNASVKVVPEGSHYSVHNNVWNAPNKSQCIQVDSRNGAFSIVSSKHNHSVHGAPASYAFINKGCHWGLCTDTEGAIPRQVSSIVEAKSSWTTTQSAEGVFNVAYDVWFHKNAMVIGQPDGAELMIWLAYKGNIQPVGELVTRGVILEGAAWDVWAGWNGKNNVITYVRTNHTESVADLNIKSFIDDGTAKGYIQSDWYLVSLGAGFEIWQGGAGLASNAFSFEVL